ncbi:MAG: hypothetical protein GY934_09750 [Gammaproteobacteria bacterium]|nr:hypothetical protein [Gammaproteobacteria bacterium]
MKDYEERFIKSWPVSVLKKKDGVRCMAEATECLPEWYVSGYKKPRDKMVLVEHKNHVHKLLNDVMCCADLELLGGPLDGELFKAGMFFEDIVSGVQGGHPDYWPGMEYHLFDVMDTTRPFKDRWSQLLWWYNLMCRTKPGFDQVVKIVDCVTCNDIVELNSLMELWSRTDEGVIVRNPEGMYTLGKKNRDAMRWKYFKDSEYPVYDIVDGKGKNKGVATFCCWNPEVGDKDCKAAQFKADSTGKLEQRKQYFTDRDQIIGKLVTVSYQNISKYGIPRFPKCKCVRDYE